MQFSLMVAVLAALVISENSPHQPVSEVGARLLLATAAMACVVAVAVVGSMRIARQLRENPQEPRTLKKFRRLRHLHSLLWMAAAGAILFGLDWARLVRFNWHLDGLPLLDPLAVILPVILPLILSWAGFYEVDRALQENACSGEAESSAPSTRRQYVLLQLRHCLGLLLLPVLGLAAVQDVAEWLAPDLMQGNYALLIYAPPLVLLFAFFPMLLRYVWRTWPLGDGSLHERLQAAAHRAGFRCRKILVWHTNGTLVNAAVAGFLPPVRYVFLTDGLLAQLSDAEIEAVFGHEVGHVRHRHLLLRMVAMIAPVSFWLLVEQACPHVSERMEQLLVFGGLNTQIPMGLLMLGAMASYGMVVFGSYSRLLEGQADLFGCRTLEPRDGTPPVETFVSALEKLAASSGVDRHRASWQHASIARRVEFLYRATQDPHYERRFHRWVYLLSALLAAIAISPVLFLLIH
jgi:STE24 endopeptidase